MRLKITLPIFLTIFAFVFAFFSSPVYALTWTQINVDGFGEDVWGATLEIFNNNLYAAGPNALGETAVLKYNSGTSWTQVNTSGFGDSNNSYVYASAVFNNRLYLGVQNDISGAEVWEYDGTNWAQVNVDGFGGAENTLIGALVVFNNKLYAGTNGIWNVFGVRVWRYDGGTTWTKVNVDGFGSSQNQSITSMASYNSRLYVAALTPTVARVFEYDGASWVQVGGDGFGDVNNDQVPAMVVLGSYLYAGTVNGTGGAQVWKYNGSGWTQVVASGFGDAENTGIYSLVVLNGHLYAGTSNSSFFGGTGAEVWEYDGTNWAQVNVDGFSDPDNADVDSLTAFDNTLYASVLNDNTGTEVWGANVPSLLDTTPPSTPNLVWLGTLEFNYVFSHWYYTGLRPTFRGTGEPGAIITVKIQSQMQMITGTATVDGIGNWQYTPGVNLETGAHTVSIYAEDAAGNKSSTLSFSLTIDQTGSLFPQNIQDLLSGSEEQGEDSSVTTSEEPVPEESTPEPANGAPVPETPEVAEASVPFWVWGAGVLIFLLIGSISLRIIRPPTR